MQNSLPLYQSKEPQNYIPQDKVLLQQIHTYNYILSCLDTKKQICDLSINISQELQEKIDGYNGALSYGKSLKLKQIDNLDPLFYILREIKGMLSNTHFTFHKRKRGFIDKEFIQQLKSLQNISFGMDFGTSCYNKFNAIIKGNMISELSTQDQIINWLKEIENTLELHWESLLSANFPITETTKYNPDYSQIIVNNLNESSALYYYIPFFQELINNGEKIKYHRVLELIKNDLEKNIQIEIKQIINQIQTPHFYTTYNQMITANILNSSHPTMSVQKHHYFEANQNNDTKKILDNLLTQEEKDALKLYPFQGDLFHNYRINSKSNITINSLYQHYLSAIKKIKSITGRYPTQFQTTIGHVISKMNKKTVHGEIDLSNIGNIDFFLEEFNNAGTLSVDKKTLYVKN